MPDGAVGADPGRRRGRWRTAGIFLLAFALAFGLSWLIQRPGPGPREMDEKPAAAGPPAVGGNDWRDFIAAVSREDFSAMRELGGRIFAPGAALSREMADFLADFEINGFPPNRVYLLHAGGGEGKSSRVILTLGAGNRVASFLAEEMALVN